MKMNPPHRLGGGSAYYSLPLKSDPRKFPSFYKEAPFFQGVFSLHIAEFSVREVFPFFFSSEYYVVPPSFGMG